jgi:hypothetical protein
VESEGRQMKQCWIKYEEKTQKIPQKNIKKKKKGLTLRRRGWRKQRRCGDQNWVLWLLVPKKKRVSHPPQTKVDQMLQLMTNVEKPKLRHQQELLLWFRNLEKDEATKGVELPTAAA